MDAVSLHDFIGVNRDELIGRCRAKVASRSEPSIPEGDPDHGVPLFLDQLVNELAGESTNTREISSGAIRHGRDLFFLGLTLSQVVHDYGDVCQSITDLAVESKAPINSEDFRTLNRCLDDAIAGAVSEYSRQQRMMSEGVAQGQSLELKNLAFTALTAFEVLQSGSVGIGGTTGSLVRRTLLAIQTFAER
jgi:hypothetical protein